MKSSNIGGQAVMEGIMMRHKDKYSIAVRRPDQEIELKVEDYKCTFGNHAFLKKPIIRGVVSFVDSLVVGTKCLMYSADFQDSFILNDFCFQVNHFLRSFTLRF